MSFFDSFTNKNRHNFIMAKFKIKDKHIAFINAIATGMTASTAYIEHMAVNPKVTKASANVTASRLLSRPEIKDLLQRTRLKHEETITGLVSRQIAAEFSTPVLTVSELDAFHSAIIQGKINVEEVIPVYKWVEIVNDQGKVVKRVKEANFMKITRPPNIREKQISIDAMYKRQGSYAPSKLFAAVGSVNDEGDLENVERMVVFSDGSTKPLMK